MEQHHKEAIEIFLKRYSDDESILAILLGGSLAHGFAVPDSDIDVAIIVDSEEFQKRKKERKLAFSLWDICTYEHGYVDCKVVDLAFLQKIAEHGSDASRYAFKDSIILYTKIEGLEELLAKVVKYPEASADDRRKRFASQILAWKWYFGEGVKKNNKYIQSLAVQKFILFSARIVLNENRMLFPFHKWMLKELETAPDMPEGMMTDIYGLLDDPSNEKINVLYNKVFDFIGFSDNTVDWPNYFMADSEQNWIDHEPPVDDL